MPVDLRRIERQRHEIPKRGRQADIAHLRRCTAHAALCIRGGIRRRGGPLHCRPRRRTRRGRIPGPECAVAHLEAGFRAENRLAAGHDLEGLGRTWIPLHAAKCARFLRAQGHPRMPRRRRMKRRQIVEAGQIVRLHEGTRERCFAPIRNGQILRHDGILSRYQVEPAGSEEGPGRPPHGGLGMPFAFSAGQPRGRASSCRAQVRGGRRLAASIAVDGRAALPSGGGVAAGVCSQLLQCAGLGGLAARVVGVGGGCFPAEI